MLVIAMYTRKSNLKPSKSNGLFMYSDTI